MCGCYTDETPTTQAVTCSNFHLYCKARQPETNLLQSFEAVALGPRILQVKLTGKFLTEFDFQICRVNIESNGDSVQAELLPSESVLLGYQREMGAELYTCRCHLTKGSYYRHLDLLAGCEESLHYLLQMEGYSILAFAPNSNLPCFYLPKKENRQEKKNLCEPAKITWSDSP